MGYITKDAHPFQPRSDGKGCRQYVDVVDHRPVECTAVKTAAIHTGTRPSPPELDFRPPLCSMCGAETSHDGDSICCDPCGAYWSGTGSGGWYDPDVKVCTATRKPFDRADLQYEELRDHVEHCLLPDGHDGDHRAGEFDTWSDDSTVGRTR